MAPFIRTAATATAAATLAAGTFLAVPQQAYAATAAATASADAATTVATDTADASTDADTPGGLGQPRAPGWRGVHAQAPERSVVLSAGTGQLIVLPRPITGMFVADEKIADVNVKSTTQLYLFGKSAGQTSIYATDRSGAVVWSTQVRVGSNIADIGAMLTAAMPEADIRVTNLSGMVMLTGTVLGARDAEEAQRLTEAFTANSVQVINRLKIATAQQVSLHVKIAEVSRSISRAIGVNLRSADNGGGFLFGIMQGREGAIADNLASFTASGIGTTLGLGGKFAGLDLRGVLDLAETDGLVSTLAEPNLVAMSGETASFLAGGEIPIPQSQGLGTVSVAFKQYGVSLSFTPTVLSAGRIAMRVRPEVSELSDSGAVRLNGFTVPALTTRRAETTVELGSGQSFVIGGLLQNNHNNSVDKAPILGDIPILGALFRSNSFRKQETELMIVVTPYIVKPIDASRIALPTDGYRSASPVQRILGGQMTDSHGGDRPKPQIAPAPLPAPLN